MMKTLTSETLRGTYPAIVTPFESTKGEIDYKSLKQLIAYQQKAGVNGLVVAGSTGEAATLSDDEYRSLLEFVIKEVNGTLPVIAGINANSSRRAVQISKEAERLGTSALLLVVPFYNKPSQEGIRAHFTEVRESVSTPIIAYNVPGRTASNLQPQTYAKMVEDKLVIGLKDASGSMEQMLETIRLCGDKTSILAGEDYLVYSCMTAGGKGVISATANIVPEMFVTITSGCLQNDWEIARQTQLKLLPIVSSMFMETNPVPVKEALALRKIIASPSVRLPLLGASEKTRSRLTELFLT